MKWFAETTVWTDTATPNGVYLLDDGKTKMYAFRPGGSDKIKTFKNFIRIDTRGRKFVEVKPSPFLKAEPVDNDYVIVKGSKGEEYKVNTVAITCSCPGFSFRGRCRHLDSLK